MHAVAISEISGGHSMNPSGFSIFEERLPADVTRELVACVEGLAGAQSNAAKLTRQTEAYGLRNVLDEAGELRGLLRHTHFLKAIERILGDEARAVRAIVFDKPFRANWFVPWHQDQTIAVVEKIEMPGFDNWTRKAGVIHVRPPAEILSRMVTLRIHLDDTTASNGALRVVPGSHTGGIIGPDRIAQYVASGVEICEVPAGGAMLMCPLLLHSSEASDIAGHRRVLHIEFSADELPVPLLWRWRVRW